MLSTHHPFWSEGLRPFFLLGAAFAALSIPLWILLVSGTVELQLRGGLLAWHMHESLFGFVVAAVAGFLTTAVPQWTGQKPISGMPLALLFLLWVLGRAAWLMSASLPGWVVALIDLALLPTLCVALGAGIVRGRQWRNLPILGLVLILAGANLMTHLGVLELWADGLDRGSSLGLFTVILLISIIGGRIVPNFTRNALRKDASPVEIPPRPGLAAAGNLSVAVAGGLIVFSAAPAVAGSAALIAAFFTALRLIGWHGWATWRMPLLWVLHLAYLWVPIGLALYGLAKLGAGVPESAALHALSVGAAGTMILAVTSRAALGHTGRPLVAPVPMVVAYGLLTLSAASRVLAGFDIGGYTLLLHTSAACWSGSFLIFLAVYLPILTRPRVSAASQTS